MKNRRVQFDPQAWIKTHMAHLAPAHVWGRVESVPRDYFVCANCPLIAHIGDTIPLPCRGATA